MQRHIHLRLYSFRICLYHFPRFFIGQIFVAQSRHIHQFAQSFSKSIPLNRTGYHCGISFQFVQSLCVDLRKNIRFWHNPIIIFMRQNQHSINKIAENRRQFIIISRLKIFPSKIIVFGFRRISCQCIAQNILLPRKIFQIFMQPNGPVF